MDDLPHIPHMPRADTVTESVLHFLAREAQIFLRWTVVGLMIVTVITMVLFNFWAIIPATLLLVSYGLLMLANTAERRAALHERVAQQMAHTDPVELARSKGQPVVDEERHPENEMPMPLLKHETVMISLGVLVVLVLAAVLAVTFLDWQKVLIAVPFIGAYIILLSSPAWFAALEDDIEEETHRLEETRSDEAAEADRAGG